MEHIPNLSEDDLQEIAYGDHPNWHTVDSIVIDQSRWGYYVQVVFTDKDADGYCFSFTYEQGSGDSYIDFDPSPVEEVVGHEVTKIEWLKVVPQS